jgi:hypothetical protein
MRTTVTLVVSIDTDKYMEEYSLTGMSKRDAASDARQHVAATISDFTFGAALQSYVTGIEVK